MKFLLKKSPENELEFSPPNTELLSYKVIPAIPTGLNNDITGKEAFK